MQSCVGLGYFDVDKEMLIFSKSEQYSHADNNFNTVLVLHPTFDAAATTAFFGTPAQLNLDACTIGQLVIEGIANVVDLTDFTKDDIDSITRNFKRPPHILNAAGNLVVQAAFTFPMKPQK